MIPAAILVVVIAGAVGLWLIYHGATGAARDANLLLRVDRLEGQVQALRGLVEDTIVGHVHEARLRSALARVFDYDEDDGRPEPRARRRAP